MTRGKLIPCRDSDDIRTRVDHGREVESARILYLLDLNDRRFGICHRLTRTQAMETPAEVDALTAWPVQALMGGLNHARNLEVPRPTQSGIWRDLSSPPPYPSDSIDGIQLKRARP